MEVILAKSAGFCFGVKRAVETVYQQVEKGGHIYTYGPIIHNEAVVRDLEEKGVSVIKDTDLDRLEDGTVIIRSHGVPREVCGRIEKQGLTCVDATCPFVKRIHTIVEQESRAGKQIIVIGNPGHPEVEGIMGWSETPAIVIESEKEAQNLDCPPGKDICLVSQTTFNYNKFQELVEIIQKKGYNISVANTICNATEERQAEAKLIASQVDAMIVIGGTHSSNTAKLDARGRRECETTCFIQTLDDLQLDFPESVFRVGITAGASTPNYIIEEVQNYVRVNF